MDNQLLLDTGLEYDITTKIKKLVDSQKESIGIAQLTGQENIKTEMRKCDVVCANCHAIRTEQRRVANEN